jgi:hypothetical protein
MEYSSRYRAYVTTTQYSSISSSYSCSSSEGPMATSSANSSPMSMISSSVHGCTSASSISTGLSPLLTALPILVRVRTRFRRVASFLSDAVSTPVAETCTSEEDTHRVRTRCLEVLILGPPLGMASPHLSWRYDLASGCNEFSFTVLNVAAVLSPNVPCFPPRQPPLIVAQQWIPRLRRLM